MLNKHIKVSRPKKTKLLKSKNIVYVYHVISSKYDPLKKYNVDSKICIGKMIDDAYMIPNDNYFKYYTDDSAIKELPCEISDTMKIGNLILIDKIFDDLQLSDLIQSIYPNETSLIKDLVSYILVEETTVMQYYPDYAWNHSTLNISPISDVVIGQFLKKGMSKENIALFLRAWNQLQEKTSIYISYDSTNFNCEASGVELAEYGHAKDDEELPQINLSYAINHKTGTPLFYELYPGSIIDNSQCSYMAEKAKEYGYENIGFILDRGYFSAGNIRYFDDNGYDFLIMVKPSTKIAKEAIEEVRIKLKNNITYYISGYEVSGITVERRLYSEDKKKRYVHVYYNNIAGDEMRNQQLENIMKKEEELKRKIENHHKKSDLESYEKLFKIKYDQYENYIKHELNVDKVNEMIKDYGFFVIVTSKKMDAIEALETYRNRDSIEKMFRSLKSQMGMSRLRVHSQAAIEAKVHITFIAGIVRNEIFQKLMTLKKESRKYYTITAALRELDKIEITKNNQQRYVRNYCMTAKQKKIMKLFEIDEKYVDQAVDSWNKALVIKKD